MVAQPTRLDQIKLLKARYPGLKASKATWAAFGMTGDQPVALGSSADTAFRTFFRKPAWQHTFEQVR